MSFPLDRQGALDLLHQWIANPALRKHMIAVEAAMRAYARKFGEPEEAWAIIGLVHDLDYEKHPSQEAGHPFVGVKALRELGFPEEALRAILSHADYSGVDRQSLLEKTLYSCDELCGFVTAVALVKGRSLANVDAESVRKKMRDKAFARAVNREDIARGAEDLGIPLDDHIAFVIDALRDVAPELGLTA
jgi:putative nucleotidyltransferase with HDIG domain